MGDFDAPTCHFAKWGLWQGRVRKHESADALVEVEPGVKPAEPLSQDGANAVPGQRQPSPGPGLHPEETIVGGKDPDQALDDAATQATKVLQDYNSRVGQ